MKSAIYFYFKKAKTVINMEHLYKNISFEKKFWAQPYSTSNCGKGLYDKTAHGLNQHVE